MTQKEKLIELLNSWYNTEPKFNVSEVAATFLFDNGVIVTDKHNRLTDNRFVSDGFYQPKDKSERLEIYAMKKPTYKEIYNRLAYYENLIEEVNA